MFTFDKSREENGHSSLISFLTLDLNPANGLPLRSLLEMIPLIHCKGLPSVGPKSKRLGTTLAHSTCMDLLENLGSLQDFGSGRRREALICGDTSLQLGKYLVTF